MTKLLMIGLCHWKPATVKYKTSSIVNFIWNGILLHSINNNKKHFKLNLYWNYLTYMILKRKNISKQLCNEKFVFQAYLTMRIIKNDALANVKFLSHARLWIFCTESSQMIKIGMLWFDEFCQLLIWCNLEILQRTVPWNLHQEFRHLDAKALNEQHNYFS